MKKITRRQFFKVAACAGIGAIVYKIANFYVPISNAKGRIIIVGGGAAGISLAALLQRFLSEPDITLIDPSDRHFYQPGFTLVASGVYGANDVWKSQEDCVPDDIKWIKDSATAIDPIEQKVATEKNGEFGYDFLVLAPGLQIDWNLIEGISYETLGEGNAFCIYDFEGAQQTWQGLQTFGKKGGQGLFTDTYTKHKCGGVPKKMCLLTEHYGRKQGTRKDMDISFYSASEKLYNVPFYTPRLEEIYEERNIPVNLNVRLKGIDTAIKRAYFEKSEKVDEKEITTLFTEDYDFMHFTPPMSAPDFVKQSGLSWTEGNLAPEGWVMTDKETLVHKTYSNIICLGDCAGIPTSKTSSAIRKQIPVAAKI